MHVERNVPIGGVTHCDFGKAYVRKIGAGPRRGKKEGEKGI